jgi:hypothetical protein
METHDSFEELIDVFLYNGHVVGIGKDFYKLVIGNKIKAREESSFDFEIVL